MRQYLDALRFVLENGVDRNDRTGTGTRAYFGMQQRYSMRDGFPAVTTKKLAWKSVVSELLWFIEGSNDERRLAEILHGTRSPEKQTIWTANAHADYWKPHARFEGDVGNIYGVQWRKWKSGDKEVDQLATVIEKLKRQDSFKRRLIVTAWHPGQLDYDEQEKPGAALSPCHILFQFFVAEGKLSLQMYQRSCDMFLGVPFNIASYSLLLSMVAQVTGLRAGDFVHTLGDAHIYSNHFSQVGEQLTRNPLPLPSLWINPSITDINDFTMNDIRLDNYQSHPPIKADMAV
jgi:thymidylate synthase